MWKKFFACEKLCSISMEFVTNIIAKYIKGVNEDLECSDEDEFINSSGNQTSTAEVEFGQTLDFLQEESNSSITLSSQISDPNNTVLNHEEYRNSNTLKGSEYCATQEFEPSNSQRNSMGEVSDSQLQMSDIQDKSSIEFEIRAKSDLRNQKQPLKNDHSIKAEILHYQKLLTDYEKTISSQCTELEKLKQEHETTSRHFATLELAFSDVLQKYDRSKIIVDGFKSNEEALTQNLQIAEEKLKQNEAKYESLKTYAKSQIEKCNVEILNVRDKYEFESSKLRALIKRLEIKCSSLETSLNQKTEECEQLSALCDDITGKQV